MQVRLKASRQVVEALFLEELRGTFSALSIAESRVSNASVLKEWKNSRVPEATDLGCAGQALVEGFEIEGCLI